MTEPTIKLTRREPGGYWTADGWFSIEKSASGWTISKCAPAKRHRPRFRLFLYRLAHEWPHKVPIGETRIERRIKVSSLAEAKQALLAVGYRSLPQWRCRECGGGVAPSNGSWRHYSRPSCPHKPVPIDGWEWEEEHEQPGIAVAVARLIDGDLDHPAVLPLAGPGRRHPRSPRWRTPL
jgi:hypothetical protein